MVLQEGGLHVQHADRRALAALPDAERFVFRHLYESPTVAVMEPTNPLAAKGVLHLRDLSGCRLVQLVGPRYSPAWKLIERQLNSANVPFATEMFPALTPYDFMGINLNSSVLIMNVASGVPGAELLGGAVAVPIDPGELSLDIVMVYLESGPVEKIERFAAVLEETYRRLASPAA